MAHGNVDIVRDGYDLWNAGDMKAMLERLHPDFEYRATGLFPGVADVYRGHDGWLRFWRDFREIWESLEVRVDELRAAGDRVLALLTFNGRGRDGLEVQRPFANVWTLREGLVLRIDAFATWDEGRAAVG